MARFNFGIDTEKITEEQFFHLISWGSISAELMYRAKLKNNQQKIIILDRYVKKLRNNGMRFSDHILSLPRHKALASLITIKKEVKDMPLRALINPHIGTNLAIKLSKIDNSIRIGDVERHIKNGTFKFNMHEKKVSTQDLNKLRFSIIWLNQYIELTKKFIIRNKCLSDDAYKIFVKEGFSGLYDIAKGNKRYFKKVFSSCDEIRNYKFFKYASLEFDYIWNNKFTKTDRKKFPTAIDSLYFNNDRGNENYPVFYIFNKAIDMKRVNFFSDIGYFSYGNIQLVDQNNYHLYSDKDIFKLLHQSFGNYKI